LWLKLAKLTKKEIFGFFFKSFIFEYNHSKTVSGVFHDLKNVKIAEKSLKIGQLLPILANMGVSKTSYGCFVMRIWVNKSLSIMWATNHLQWSEKL
jgi:hypothetical protein